MTVTASSEVTRMNELVAKRGRKITELEAENERLRELLRLSILFLEEDGSAGCAAVERFLKSKLEENNDDS